MKSRYTSGAGENLWVSKDHSFPHCPTTSVRERNFKCFSLWNNGSEVSSGKFHPLYYIIRSACLELANEPYNWGKRSGFGRPIFLQQTFEKCRSSQPLHRLWSVFFLNSTTVWSLSEKTTEVGNGYMGSSRSNSVVREDKNFKWAAGVTRQLKVKLNANGHHLFLHWRRGRRKNSWFFGDVRVESLGNHSVANVPLVDNCVQPRNGDRWNSDVGDSPQYVLEAPIMLRFRGIPSHPQQRHDRIYQERPRWDKCELLSLHARWPVVVFWKAMQYFKLPCNS